MTQASMAVQELAGAGRRSCCPPCYCHWRAPRSMSMRVACSVQPCSRQHGSQQSWQLQSRPGPCAGGCAPCLAHLHPMSGAPAHKTGLRSAGLVQLVISTAVRSSQGIPNSHHRSDGHQFLQGCCCHTLGRPSAWQAPLFHNIATRWSPNTATEEHTLVATHQRQEVAVSVCKCGGVYV